MSGRREVPRWLWLALGAVAIATIVAEGFVHHHAAFGVDGSFAFYAWYSVLCAVAGVVAARVIGALLGRQERYYD